MKYENDVADIKTSTALCDDVLILVRVTCNVFDLLMLLETKKWTAMLNLKWQQKNFEPSFAEKRNHYVQSSCT